MSRHSSASSYYQPSSRPDSPAQFSPSASQQHPPPPHQNQSSSSSSSSGTGSNHHQQSGPQQPPPPPRNQKADQILQNFYVKVIQIVVLARVTHTDPHAGSSTLRKGSLRGVPLVKKTSKWFNLELEDLDIYKEDAKFWRAIAITESPPAMLVELLLDTSELSQNQMLVLVDENNRKNRVDLTGSNSVASTPMGPGRARRNIILESWSLTLSNTPPDPVPEPPVVYKKSIIFFRSLFAYMRLLPAYQLYRRLRKQNYPLKIGFRVSRGHSPEESMFRDSEIGIEVPLVEGETRPMLAEFRFGQVETSLGAFSLKVTYRSNCEFHVDESEAVLSSKFIDMDENYFTPTIVTHSQESAKPMRRPSLDGPQRRSQSSTMAQRPSSELYTSGSNAENFASSLRGRRNSGQSLQIRSGENSSSQSSVSSLGTRMSRRGSSGALGLPASADSQNAVGTPPFSLAYGGHVAVAKHYVDSITESPPFKMGTSQSDSRRGLSSTFSPFKSPSLSSSPSPSYLDALPTTLSSRPSSIHLNRSPSSSSMHRVHSSQQGSGLIGFTGKSGSILAANIAGVSTGISSAGVNLLSTSAKSNASSTSAPRVTSSFGHRHDSSSRRASSESLPPGRGNRNSIIGSSSLFQLTPDDDDVNAFVQMLAAPEPLKLFGKTGNSGLGPSFGSGDGGLSASALRNKSALDRFQQLKQSNTSLSDSMSASQVITKDQQQAGSAAPLSITTGHLSRRSTLSDMGPGANVNSGSTSTGNTVVTTNLNRHSQSFSHQPPTPSPLHSEIPVHRPLNSGRSDSQPIRAQTSNVPFAHTGSTPTKRHSWLLGGASNSAGSSSSGMYHDVLRKGSNMSSIAFRHGSLDQRRGIIGMEEAMERMSVATPDDMAFGSFPEDVHHQHSLYSAPLDTGRDKRSSASDSSPIPEVPFGPDPRPIPAFGSGNASGGVRPGRLMRLGSGSSITLPRLRPRTAEDNESLNDRQSADSVEERRDHQRRGQGSRDDYDDEEEEYGYENDSHDMRSGDVPDYRQGAANTSLNDDDDMLFIMSELSPGSNSGQDNEGLGVTGTGLERDRGMLPLTGAMLNLRSQSQSPSLGPHHLHSHQPHGGSGTTSSSSSPHLRIFGRAGTNVGNNSSNNFGADHGNNQSHHGGGNSRSSSASHSRVGSTTSHTNHNNNNGQSSVDNLVGLSLRRPGSGSTSASGSGSGFIDEYNLPSTSSTPPSFLPTTARQETGAGAFEAMLEGRRMSRGGSDRGMGVGGSSSNSGANSGGHNSIHSDTRGGATLGAAGGRIEGW
ncbi:autophagy protein 13 [Mortierella claussenii]|nr:autophagy protein 13 [Mortierella claussenii]